MDFPKTSNPEKWINDVALSKSDLMDNKIAGEDMEDFCKRLGLPKPKYRFENGKAIKRLKKQNKIFIFDLKISCNILKI